MSFRTQTLLYAFLPLGLFIAILLASILTINENVALSNSLAKIAAIQRRHGIADMMHDHIYGITWQAYAGVLSGN